MVKPANATHKITTCPNESQMIFYQHRNGIITERMWIEYIGLMVDKLPSFWVKLIQPRWRTQPKFSISVFLNQLYIIINQTIGVFWVMPIIIEVVAGFIKSM